MADKQTEPGQDVALYKARLPYNSRFEEVYGIDKGSWRTLVEAIWPAAKSVESVQMALAYCKKRNLDPFKRPVHIVPVYSTLLKAMVETVWPGISEIRTTASRTQSYAGMKPTEFGPTVIKKLKNDEGVEREFEFPEWARITVVRMVMGTPMDFPGPMVRWMETYATESRKSDWPNAMWQKRPWGQLEKCAEAASLRRAFPEEVPDYTVEEMEGREYHGGGIVIDAEQDVSQMPGDKGPPKGPPPVKGVEHKPDKQLDTQIEHERERDPEPEAEDMPQAEEVSEQERKPEPAKGKDKKPPAAAKKPEPAADKNEEDFQNLVKSLKTALKQGESEDSEKPLFEWITATKPDRTALMKAGGVKMETRLKQLLAAAYANPVGGPDILDPILEGGAA